MGGDSLDAIDKWYHPEIVLANCTLLAAGRDDIYDEALIKRIDELNNKYNADIRLVKLPRLDISSTDIRAGEIEDVPESVAMYIKKQDLYGF
mgnify:CR=1 FL=1